MDRVHFVHFINFMKRHGIRSTQQKRRNPEVSLSAAVPGRFAHEDALCRISFGKRRYLHLKRFVIIRKINTYVFSHGDSHDGCQFPADDQILFRHGHDLLISREPDHGLVILQDGEQTCPGSIAAMERYAEIHNALNLLGVQALLIALKCSGFSVNQVHAEFIAQSAAVILAHEPGQ